MARAVFALDDERRSHGVTWAEGVEAERRRLVAHLIQTVKGAPADAFDTETAALLIGARVALQALAAELLESLK